MTNQFKQFWKAINNTEVFAKADALSLAEINQVQKKIDELQARHVPSSKIISALQKFSPKLSERYKAERAYWTEVKRLDTEAIADTGDELGISKYKVVLSPSACKLCRNKSDNGQRIFDQKDVAKTGYGQFVPWHPNCYCIAIPYE